MHFVSPRDVSGENGLEKIFYTLLKIHDEIEKGDDTGSLRDLVRHKFYFSSLDFTP